MTKGQGLRQYRACVRCRTRKTRCDLQSLGEAGKPPCAKCAREGSECVLAGSRRGGDYTQYRRPKKQRQFGSTNAGSSYGRYTDHVSPRQQKLGDGVHDSLQNPSDALLILAHAAGEPEEDADNSDDVTTEALGKNHRNVDSQPRRYSRATRGASGSRNRVLDMRHAASVIDSAAIESYPLIRDGTMDIDLMKQLLREYGENYHQFFPLVPAATLQAERILDTIKNEAFLLTTILVIASKDRSDLAMMHKSIWNKMKLLILDVVLGSGNVRRVGCVEGLLLLGEWTVLNHGQAADGGESASWSIIGLAVRLAYSLRLEDSSFKLTNEDADAVTQRERLAWTFTYLCDRQISIRMGQAFWCRGPSLSTRFTAQDFPSLQPRRPHDEDLASLLQAQIELTTLFGNAHDILFASRSRTAELMTRGDYTKYVDDTTRAMAAWQQVWETISVSSHLRNCLMLTYEYLRLYVNAFAFQAVLYRESSKKEAGPSYFPSSIMGSPDARHIYAAIDAAERMLTIIVDEIDPEKHLRYMPARFYLYEIHSAVFLYKAHAVGAVESEMHATITNLMRRFISVLSIAAVDDNHIASRYARLLERLWLHRSMNPEQTEVQIRDLGSIDPPALVGSDLMNVQMPFVEEFALQPFDCSDTFDALFSIPPGFPTDQVGFPWQNL